MALPKLTGYGYDAAANYQRRVSSYGSGMVLPTMQIPHSMGTAGSPPQSIRSGGTQGPVMSAGSAGAGRAPALWGSPAPSQRPVGPVSPLQWGVGARQRVTGPSGARSPLNMQRAEEGKALLGGAVTSRLQRFQQRNAAGDETADGQVRQDETGESASTPLPDRARPEGTHPLLGPSGSWAEAPTMPGAPVPSTRAPRGRRSAFNPNQGLLF